MSDDMKVEDFTEEQARAAVDFILSLMDRVVSTRWFVVGVLVGVCGNIVSSGLIELIKLWVPNNWPWIVLGLSAIAFVLLFRFILPWYKIYKELESSYYQTLDKYRPLDVLTRKAFPKSSKSESQDHQNHDSK